MQPSTAQRERLVSPLALLFMAVLFALSFYILKPDSVPGLPSLGGESEPSQPSAAVDELSLAYLKAQRSSGALVSDELTYVVRKLVESRRFSEARKMLGEYPDLDVGEALRFELDLEKAVNDSPVSLYAALEHFIRTPTLHQKVLLQRAVTLSKPLNQPRLTAELFSVWAESSATPAEALKRYQDCGRYLIAHDQSDLGMQCLNKAESLSIDPVDLFDTRLVMIAAHESPSLQQDALMQRIVEAEEIPVDKLEQAAVRVLQIGRPDVAYRLYAKMSLIDAERSDKWLGLAAKWAQAAGKPAEASVFVDARLRQWDELKGSKELRDNLHREMESLLIATGQEREAYSRVQVRIERNPNDVDALRQGVTLARKLGEYSQALYWNTQVLSFDSSDVETIRLQRGLAMATGNLTLAMRWARRLVEQNPTSAQEREVLAKITEWSGRPTDALEQWQWLLSRRQNVRHEANARKNLPEFSEKSAAPTLGAAEPKATQTSLEGDNYIATLREVVRLAEMTLQPGLAAETLNKIAEIELPSSSDIARLVALYDMDGYPEKATEALRNMIALYGVEPFVLRTLASHEFSHGRYDESLIAWNHYAETFGHSTEATLARVELLWRLDRKDTAAMTADHLRGQSLLAEASDYQLRLMAEIAWRYRKPWLSSLVQPRLEALEMADQRNYYGRRSLEQLQEQGDDHQALAESLQLWEATGELEFALLAIRLAAKTNDEAVIYRFQPEQAETEPLHTQPSYWARIAEQKAREADSVGAIEAYRRALRLKEFHIESVAGLLWLAIGNSNDVVLKELLDRYKVFAEETPSLWQAVAVGYLQLGAASQSLRWFDKLLEQIEADYSMLLTYADALEYAGRSAMALKVRRYTLQQLRPVLLSGTLEEQDLLLRQYTRLSASYAGVEPNEQLFAHLLKKDVPKASSMDDLWRQDMAMSWLMATQQFEHARLIMSDIHARRLQAPAWQKLALALNDQDDVALTALIQSKGPLSVGNHILALRQLGHDREAYALVQQVMRPGSRMEGSTPDDLLLAQEQYVSLRDAYPSFVEGSLSQRKVGEISVNDSGVRIRHSLSELGLGVALDLTRRRLDSERFDLTDAEEATDMALSLFFGDTRRGGRITAGYLNAEDSDLLYASASFAQRMRDQRSQLSAELAYNEEVGLSPELLIAARQHRLSVGLDANIGRQEFIRMQADATEINTRVEEHKVARGIGGTLEVGVRGSFGSNVWSTSVSARHVEHDRESQLPGELQLSNGSTMNSVLAAKAQSLSLGASLSRGGINADFPQVSSPRYYVNASLGQNWPNNVLGFQLGAGAGIRVLGGDELSFSVSHDTQPTVRRSGESTAFGINYRFHFQ